MNRSPAEVQLWSVQTEGAYEVFRRSGVVHASDAHVDPSFVPAYTWMAGELEKRVAKPSGFNGTYPVWAWFQYAGLHRQKPRVGERGLLAPGTRGVLLELFVAPELLLLSDFQKWHAVLNKFYLPEDSKEQRAFDAWVASLGDGESLKGLARARIEASWSRIFDIDAPGSDCWEGPEEREIQAVLWQIEASMVSSVEHFVAAT